MKKKNNAINFVAEVGCNHQGSFKLAKKMIDVLANFCEVKFVKFQNLKEFIRNHRKLIPKAP